MKLAQRISLKEREALQAHLALEDSVMEFRRVFKAKLASRTALTVGFAGGWLLGFLRSKRSKPERAHSAAHQDASISQRQGMPKKWLRSYFVWPFLLATARDLIVSHRPSRREA